MEASQISQLIRKLRKPFLYSLLFTAIFFIFLFPTGDLGDLVSSKVSELTQNQVFLQFGNFNFDIAPPGVEFSEVFVETAFTPGISAEEISIAPSISGMISQKPYGSVSAKGLLNGELQLSVKKGQPTETGNERQRLILDVEKISLAALRELMKWSLALEGNLSVSADGQGDLALSEQPDVDLNVAVDKFSLPPATINTMMGPLTLPDMKLGEVHLKGRLSNGKFNIETGDIGKKQDDLHGKIKGFWNINLMMMGGRPVPQIGSYDLEIDLVANKNFQAKASLFLSLLDQYKSGAPDGARYRFKVSAADLMSPPSITGPR
jgi:type II secretion system protein N